MPLGAVCLKDLPCVGGKAAHLGKMIAAGLPVPSGFVVTTDACRRFIQSDPRIAKLLEGLQACDHQNPEALRGVTDEVRQQLSAIVMPRDVADAIVAAMKCEAVGPRAVRSSATVEDMPEASFAGQHDSFLNVIGPDAILDAVKRCWISLFSERAISYRMRKGIAPGCAQMAVIVQQMIDADSAGVMFTADPAGCDSDCILIEAAFGLGEVVVQGKVTPDRIAVSRSNLKVVRRDTGLKQLQIVAAKDGISEQILAAEKAMAPVLDDGMAVRLAQLGLAVEQVFDRPLDIEWSVRGQEIWLLQARPVTTSQHGKASTFEDRQVWTNANGGEVLPDVVTPMTWSLLLPEVRKLWNRFLGDGGLHITEDQIIRLIAGRVYFNFNTLCALRRFIPGLGNQTLDNLFGGRQDRMLALKQINISNADLPQIKINWWQAVTGLPVLPLKFLFFSTRRGEMAVQSTRRANDDMARIKAEPLSDEELLIAIRLASDAPLLRDGKSIDAFGIGACYPAVLFGVCKQWFSPKERSTGDRLLAAVGDLDSAATGHDLWLLAEQAASEPEIKSALLGEHAFKAFAQRLETCRNGQAFLTRWDSFMHRHGHHTRGEIELFNPRWSECPDFVLEMVRGYMEAIDAGHPAPTARRKALAGERVVLANECLRRLRNPLKRTIFRLVLHRAQKGGGFRENLKSEAIRRFALLRRFLLELGRRLATRGRIENADDVFFLEIEEVQSSTLWDAGTNLKAIIAGRRALYEQNLKITPPAVIVGRFDPHTFLPVAVDHGTNVFHGLGVSAGIATGRARVILRSDAHERIQPGEILVAPFIDPGWTPYFVAAAGIVMDMGGMLSHGSIVAREYGIPAVVNVGPATQIIRTGQWLEVDADRGVVRVIDGPR